MALATAPALPAPAGVGERSRTENPDATVPDQAPYTPFSSSSDTTATAPREIAAQSPTKGVRRHILTVSLQDYFQVATFQRLVKPERWDRFETRLEVNTALTLDLLDRFDTKATFFVLGWIADRYPELVRQVAERGHEVASSGFYHKSVSGRDPAEFRDDLLRAGDAIEAATGQPVRGFRAADGWIGPRELWALDVLAGLGYQWDSSLMPTKFGFRQSWRRIVHEHRASTGTIIEVPPSTINLGLVRLPIAGGNWFRQLPHTLVKQAVARWHRNKTAPFVMYFHTWELDPEQPRISATGLLGRVRHYRNLDKMSWVLEDYLGRYDFGPVGDVLGLPATTPLRGKTTIHPPQVLASLRTTGETTPSRGEGLHSESSHNRTSGLSEPPASDTSVSRVPVDDEIDASDTAVCLDTPTATPAATRVGSAHAMAAPSLNGAAAASGQSPADRPPAVRPAVTIVIPCYNEERTIPYLARTLDSVRAALSGRWSPRFLFVDDCSRDHTHALLVEKFGPRADCRVVRHEQNRGVAAAILTGIHAADSEIVCSIDCDCSYDPHELAEMIPLLADGVDLVTASPYHPQGHVANVPGWRLGLSKTSSWMYRRVFGRPLHTWTSCFRVYRRSAVEGLTVENGNFLGVAEIVGELCLRDATIVEYPTTLDVRIFGQSKMKVLRTIAGHLKLLNGFRKKRKAARTRKRP